MGGPANPRPPQPAFGASSADSIAERSGTPLRTRWGRADRRIGRGGHGGGAIARCDVLCGPALRDHHDGVNQVREGGWSLDCGRARRLCRRAPVGDWEVRCTPLNPIVASGPWIQNLSNRREDRTSRWRSVCRLRHHLHSAKRQERSDPLVPGPARGESTPGRTDHRRLRSLASDAAAICGALVRRSVWPMALVGRERPGRTGYPQRRSDPSRTRVAPAISTKADGLAEAIERASAQPSGNSGFGASQVASTTTLPDTYRLSADSGPPESCIWAVSRKCAAVRQTSPNDGEVCVAAVGTLP